MLGHAKRRLRDKRERQIVRADHSLPELQFVRLGELAQTRSWRTGDDVARKGVRADLGPKLLDIRS